MYISVAQFEAVGPANNDTARIVLAAVVGLLLVGLVLLGVAVAAKRRNGPPPATVTGKQATAKVELSLTRSDSRAPPGTGEAPGGAACQNVFCVVVYLT